MGKRQIKQYSQEYKRSSAKLAVDQQQSIAATARELGISDATLYAWVKRYYPNHQARAKGKSESGNDPNEPSQAELLAELACAKKEIKQLKLEHEILKKAAAYFASEQL